MRSIRSLRCGDPSEPARERVRASAETLGPERVHQPCRFPQLILFGDSSPNLSSNCTPCNCYPLSAPRPSSGIFFGTAAASTSTLALSAANRHGDHGIAHAPSRITRGRVHSVRRSERGGAGGRRDTGADASIALETGSLTCLSMRFDDQARLDPLRAGRLDTQISEFTFDSAPGLARKLMRCCPCSIGALRRKPTASKVAQLASMEPTPVALPRISAGVSKSTKYGDGRERRRGFLPSSSPRSSREIGRHGSFPPRQSGPSLSTSRRNPDAGALGALRGNRSLHRSVREDWFHERLPRARPARLLRADDGTGASERRAEPAHGGERGGSRSTERGFIPLSASKYCYLDGARDAARDARCMRAISSVTRGRARIFHERRFPLRK